MSRPENQPAHIIQGDRSYLAALGTSVQSMTTSTIASIQRIQEPKSGKPLDWKLNGREQPRAVVAKEHILPTHASIFEEIKGEWLAGIRSRKITVGNFSSGIPILFSGNAFSATGPSPLVDWADSISTVCYWLASTPSKSIPNSAEERNAIYRNANPYLRKMANALCDSINQMMQDGSWVDTTEMMIRETATDDSWKIQLVLPWTVKDTKHNSYPDGSQSMTLSLSPYLPLIGFDMPGWDIDPFGGEIHAITKAFRFELNLDLSRYDDLLDAGDEDTLKDRVLLQLMGISSTPAGEWQCFEQVAEDLEWPTFSWNQEAPSIHTNLGRARHLEHDRPENFERWEINDDDFVGDGFSPEYRERIMKSKRYGNRMEFFKPTTLAGGSVGNLLPSAAMLYAEVVEIHADHASTKADPDEEWGESSRFIPSWRDKRKTKLIDKSKGVPPYWSDTVRCNICNGKVKVHLKERPITVIFDCPHCGEGGSIDVSHLQPDREWPAEKKRKKVDLK